MTDREGFQAANAMMNLEPVFQGVVTSFRHVGQSNLMQIHILSLLQSAGAMMLSEIAKHHRVSKQHMSQLIPQMENAGLVSRFRRDDNKKNIYVSITDAGIAMLNDYIFSVSDRLSETFSELSSEDKRQITVCCERLRGLLSRISYADIKGL